MEISVNSYKYPNKKGALADTFSVVVSERQIAQVVNFRRNILHCSS